LYCGRQEPLITLTRDHIIPVSAGGHNTKSNIQGLCVSCNSKKHICLDYIVSDMIIKFYSEYLEKEGKENGN